jgi:hypothetical protein
LRKIFVDLRQLISANFDADTEREKQLFLTLTYRENVTDHVRVWNDWKLFWRKFQRRHGRGEYIIIVEPQSRGAWHIHALIKTHEPIFADKHTRADWESVGRDLYHIWGNGNNGWVDAQRITDCNNIGAYFIAYFTNAEIPPDKLSEYEKNNDVRVLNGLNGEKKYVAKGERLKFYGDYMRIYRNSRGVEKPDKRVLHPYREIWKIPAAFPKITYENHTEIETDDETNDGKKRALQIVNQQRVDDRDGGAK